VPPLPFAAASLLCFRGPATHAVPLTTRRAVQGLPLWLMPLRQDPCPPFSPLLPRRRVRRPTRRALLEMLRGDRRPLCLLEEGSWRVAEQWELVARVHGGMASLVQGEGDGTSGLHMGSPITVLTGHILLCPLPGGFVCRFKTEKPQVRFESLLTQLEGVTGNFHSQLSRGTTWLSTTAQTLWMLLHDPAWKTTSLWHVLQHCYRRRVPAEN